MIWMKLQWISSQRVILYEVIYINRHCRGKTLKSMRKKWIHIDVCPYIAKKYKGRGRSEAIGKTKVCPQPAGAPHFDSPIFCELKTVFRLKIEWKLAKGQGFFENSLPLKFYFSKIFEKNLGLLRVSTRFSIWKRFWAHKRYENWNEGSLLV